MAITITKKDYVDLKYNNTDRNIINSVSGNEYRILNIQNQEININLASGTPGNYSISQNALIINPNTLNQIFNGTTYTSANAKENIDLQCNYAGVSGTNIIYGSIVIYGRTESLFYKGQFSLTTTDTISLSKDNISCGFTINYTKSTYTGQNTFTFSNYNINNKTQFFNDGKTYPINSTTNLTTNQFLPVQNSNLVITNGSGSANIEIPNEEEYIRCINIENSNGVTILTFDFNIRIWAGYVDHSTSAFTTNISENVLCINNITLKFYSPTIELEQQSFVYGNNLQGNNYQLEDSELMMFTLNDNVSNKLSYKTSNKIMDSFKTNRIIVEFEIVNPKQYEIDESSIYESGTSVIRYIEENDTFTLYNEFNELVGDFRVLQAKYVWDGFYHIYIVAIQI